MAEDMIAMTKRELESWPGARVSFANSGKHITATLAYKGQTRMVVCAKSLSDNARGGKNHIATVRRELLALGAARVARKKATGPRRERNKTTRPPPPPCAPVVPNGFEKLAGFTPAPTPKPSPPSRLSRVLAWFRRLARV